MVKRYAMETGTAWVQAWCGQADHVIAVSLIGLVEVAAAVAGKRCGGIVDPATADAIMSDLKADAAMRYSLVPVWKVA